MKLVNRNQNIELVSNLKVARDFWSRGVGLLGKTHLPENQALLIERCNSIHTCFMKFSIDCIFVSDEFTVVDSVKNIKPWRLILPRWKAKHVIELHKGFLEKHSIQKGDQLDVVS